MANVGLKIQQLLEERNLTHNDLANYLGVARQTIGKYINGVSDLKQSTIIQISEYFGVTTDFLSGIELNSRFDRSMFSNRLKKFHDLSHLSNESGIELETLQSYINCKEPIPPTTAQLKEIANNPSEFIELLLMCGYKKETYSKENITIFLEYLKTKQKQGFSNVNTETAKIPILGSVVAGIPIEAQEDVKGYELISNKLAKQGTHFALDVIGDSMSPRFLEGDTVIVRHQPDAETGDIVVALVNGDCATLKKLKKTDSGIMLMPLNNVYEPMFFTNDDIENLPVTIVGKVVQLRSNF